MYYFDPGENRVKKNDFVIVETSRGVEYGMVEAGPRLASQEDVVMPLRTILRLATEEDKKTYAHNLEAEKEAMEVCREKIAKHGLDMNLVDSEYTFDGRKIVFYFTAENRVDFRELVKDLASYFKTRIELRQIGVRDEARLLGGYGICGRPYCCTTFVSDFAPVSIKMVKDQNLSLIPSKSSGTCGRLMCCLRYEESTYEELNKILPSEGDTVETPNGTGEVLHVNVLRQLVKVGISGDREGDVDISEFPVDQITIVKRRRHGQAHPQESSRDSEEENPQGKRS